MRGEWVKWKRGKVRRDMEVRGDMRGKVRIRITVGVRGTRNRNSSVGLGMRGKKERGRESGGS